MVPYRGTNNAVYIPSYRYFKGDCKGTPNMPIDVGNHPIPTMVPVTTITF